MLNHQYPRGPWCIVGLVKPIFSAIVVHRSTRILHLLSMLLLITGFLSILFILPDQRFALAPISLISMGIVLQIIINYSRLRLISLSYLIVQNTDWKRVVDKEVDEGEPLDVILEASIGFIGGKHLVTIVDTPPESFTLIDGGYRWFGEIGSHSKIRVRYRVKPTQGTHYFGIVYLELYDRLGLYRSRLEIPLNREVRVLPEIFMDPREIVINLSGRIPGGLSLTNRPGIGIEYYSTREYVPGDDYRYIDWKATARLQRIMIKEFEEESSLNILLYLLITPEMYRGIRGVTKLEVLSRIISTLSNYLAFRGDYFSLGYMIIASEPIVGFTGYGRGYGHTYLVRRVLSSIPWGAKYFFRDVSNELSRELSRVVRREKTNIILFSDFNDDIVFIQSILPVLHSLKRMGHEIIVVIPHTILYEKEMIKYELIRQGREELVDKVLTLHRLYCVRREEIISEIMDLIRGYGFKLVHTSPRDTIYDIVEYIELVRRYYG